jgi:hypothetical protein
MKITEASGRRPPGHRRSRRLAGSLAAGAAVAGLLVAWADLHNHAALVASAATPAPNGVHETVGFILATGGIFTALVVALAVFVIATVLARRRAARAAATVLPYPPARPRRRSRASAR